MAFARESAQHHKHLDPIGGGVLLVKIVVHFSWTACPRPYKPQPPRWCAGTWSCFQCRPRSQSHRPQVSRHPFLNRHTTGELFALLHVHTHSLTSEFVEFVNVEESSLLLVCYGFVKKWVDHVQARLHGKDHVLLEHSAGTKAPVIPDKGRKGRER